MKQLLELRKMSDLFYKTFSKHLFPEIEHKIGRPYVVLVVKINNFRFAIPLRTNIRHSYCYKFKTSDRKTESKTGIDFSKAVIIDNDNFLGEKTYINNKEYVELRNKAFFILKKFKKYVQDYINFKKHGGNEYIAKRYKYSTLQYFDKILLR